MTALSRCTSCKWHAWCSESVGAQAAKRALPNELPLRSTRQGGGMRRCCGSDRSSSDNTHARSRLLRVHVQHHYLNAGVLTETLMFDTVRR
jgi:hypothetical protein